MDYTNALVAQYADPTPLQRELWRQNLARLCAYWESLADVEKSNAHSGKGATIHMDDSNSKIDVGNARVIKG